VIHQAEIHALPTDMVRSPDRFQDRPAAGPAAWGTHAASPIDRTVKSPCQGTSPTPPIPLL